jgi:hypothetical protein
MGKAELDSELTVAENLFPCALKMLLGPFRLALSSFAILFLATVMLLADASTARLRPRVPEAEERSKNHQQPRDGQ